MKRFIILIAAIFTVGCATWVIGRYSTSADNLEAIRSWNGVKLNVGEFIQANSIEVPSCNYKGPIKTIDGDSYAAFIMKAFVSELKVAGAYSSTAPVAISGRLDKLDNSTATGTDWTIVMTFTASNGKSVTLTEKYDYNGSIAGTADSTCGASASAFVPAVQNLVGQLIQNVPKLLQ